MSDFTPGPWEVTAPETGTVEDPAGDWTFATFHIEGANHFRVAATASYSMGDDTSRCGYPRATTPEQAEANARLIAAAPELVAALEAIYATAIEPDATFSEGAFRDAILNSRALLARIKGESNE